MSHSLLLQRKYIWLGAVLVLVLFALAVFARPAHAHEGEDHSHDETAGPSEQFVPERYDYQVKSGDNMTLLVRRSLQLFDRASGDLQLSEAQIIFAETCVVQALGSRHLIYPGERIEVPSDLLQRFVRESQDLTASQLAAWQAYVPLVNFDLEDTLPRNVEIEADGSIADPQAPDTDDSQLPSAEEADQTEQGSGSWYWWFIGAGTVLLLWYLFWKRQDGSN